MDPIIATAPPAPVVPISPIRMRQWARMRIGDVGPNHVDLGHAHVPGHTVQGEARVHNPPVALIDLRLLHER